MAKLVGRTYGDALFELAVESGRTEELLAEAVGVSQVLNENDDLLKLMDHPKIVQEEKLDILEQIFKGRVSDELLGLMRLLVQKGHYKEINAVFSYFIDQIKEYKNIGTAYVTSAIPLSETQKGQVLDKLLKTTKYESFEMHYAVDQGLIGGMVIRIGDRVVDSSIRSKLNRMAKELSQVQLTN